MAIPMATPVRRAAAMSGLDAADYKRHALHAPERVWVEKNCYIDVWIELLHALGLDPMAMLPFTLAIDFEDDQWTFFKPPHGDLRSLYGVDVQEMYIWRPLLDHAVEHLAAGRFISTEADAFWLPDTAGTDYRRQHTKTTIILGEIDVAARRLAYFHNAGYHALEGEDFVQLFRLDAPPDPAFMPLYAELVRHDRALRLDPAALRASSRQLLRREVARRPGENPVRKFQARLERDMPWLAEQGLPVYHVWAFGTLRQLGAAAELSALYLRWLDPAPHSPMQPAAEALMQISTLSKAFILKAARAVNAKRRLDSAESLGPMAEAWDLATAVLSHSP
jgi:hypothetical protein